MIGAGCVNVIGTVCARGGSKGVPGKNLKLLCGKPLIVHTIEHALASECINGGVYISTDSPEISDVATAAGGRVPFLRPAHMATDGAPKVPVIQHLVEQLEAQGKRIDLVVDLDPTSPLRAVEDIEKAAACLVDPFDIVVSVTQARKNPYFNMVEQRSDGGFQLSKTLAVAPVARQTAPPVYEINGSVYVYRRHALAGGLWDSKITVYAMPAERSVDIDSEVDFRLVEMLMDEAGRGS